MILSPLPFSLTLSERDLGAFLDRIGSPSPSAGSCVASCR